MMELEDLKKALQIHENQLKQAKMDQDYAEMIIPVIKLKIEELENALIFVGERNKGSSG